MALANSLVLKLAGVTRETKDPDGGVIVRDANGEPTGVLKDAALSLVWKVFPPRNFDERVTAARAATDYAASLGVTVCRTCLPALTSAFIKRYWTAVN